MRRFKNFAGIFAFSLLVLALPAVASAQWRDRDRDRDDDGYYGNGRYNRNLESTIDGLQNRAKRFERVIDRELDRSRYDGNRREDRLNDLARDFRRAVDRLEDNYDRRNTNGSSNEANRVLQLGQQLENSLRRARFQNNVMNEWYQIQRDLDVLANAYGYNNRNNRNSRNNRNDDWRNRIPRLPW
jgi:hypothetical protein